MSPICILQRQLSSQERDFLRDALPCMPILSSRNTFQTLFLVNLNRDASCGRPVWTGCDSTWPWWQISRLQMVFSFSFSQKMEECNEKGSFASLSYQCAYARRAYGYWIIKAILEREYTSQTQWNYWCYAQCSYIRQTHTCFSKEMPAQL